MCPVFLFAEAGNPTMQPPRKQDRRLNPRPYGQFCPQDPYLKVMFSKIDGRKGIGNGFPVILVINRRLLGTMTLLTQNWVT